MIKVIDIRKYPTEKVVAYWVSQGGKDAGYADKAMVYPYCGLDEDNVINSWRDLEEDKVLIDLPQELDDSDALLETTLKSDPHSRYTAPEDQAVIHRCNITLTSVEQVRKSTINRVGEIISYEIKVGVKLNLFIEFEMNIFSQAPMSEEEIIDRVLYQLRVG
jgi:hypothetical protein